MEYTVKWIINGEIKITANSKDDAETNIKNQLKALIEKNNQNFTDLKATRNSRKCTYKKLK